MFKPSIGMFSSVLELMDVLTVEFEVFKSNPWSPETLTVVVDFPDVQFCIGGNNLIDLHQKRTYRAGLESGRGSVTV